MSPVRKKDVDLSGEWSFADALQLLEDEVQFDSNNPWSYVPERQRGPFFKASEENSVEYSEEKFEEE
jgi:hypothetical protein